MSVWGANVWGANVWGANVWGEAGEATTVGRRPKRAPRKILLTVCGNRFQVEEDDLDRWLAKQEDKIVESVKAKPRRVTVKGATKPAEAPRIVLKTDDTWLRNIVADANRRVRERLDSEMAARAAYEQMLADDDEDVLTFLI